MNREEEYKQRIQKLEYENRELRDEISTLKMHLRLERIW